MKPVVRSKFRLEGVKRVVQFNWPIYLAAFSVLLLASKTARSKSLPLRIASILIGVTTATQTSASLFASFWIYDLSKLHRWQWLKSYLSTPVKSILNIHSGYDETEGEIANCFPGANYSVIDLYPALKRREPSIEKARRLYPPHTAPIAKSLTNWPIEAGSIDLIVVPFAAHELRNRDDRIELFKQIAKTIRPETGRVILVEHLRNAANGIAFGPGYFHFFSEKEWLHCISYSGLTVLKQDKLTPFIGVLVLCRA